MNIEYHRKFKKSFKKQSRKIQQSFFKVLDVFIHDEFHYSLNNHALQGNMLGVRSFDITGNVRVHYEIFNNMIILINIGTHAQLY